MSGAEGQGCSSEDSPQVTMNYARFINAVSLARQPSPIRLATALLARSPPSTISFAGGLPNDDLFYFKDAEFKLSDGSTMKLDASKMKKALQYGPTYGLGELVSWVRNLQKTVHNPPTFNRKPEDGGLDICMTSGSADGICKAFEMLVSKGDNVLICHPVYSGSLAAVRPLGCNLLPVECDQHGMVPESLLSVLSPWSPSDANNPVSNIPRIMYIIPTGCNPTGASMTLQRKKDIYEIARQYNLLILEDDPYFFLQFSKDLVPSFLSLDVDGRVIRFDSFSKVFAPGLRVGFTSGPLPLVNRMQLHIMCSSMHVSQLSQMMINEALQKWGVDGFVQHTRKLAKFYETQKDYMISACNKHLKGLAEWDEPQAGMFLWLKLNKVKDTKALMEKAINKEVLILNGNAFLIDNEEASPYVRLSYSCTTKEQIDTGIERFASLLHEELASQQS